MYKGKNIGQHNLQQLRKAKQFLSKSGSSNAPIISVNVQVSNNTFINLEEQSEQDSNMWAQLQKMARIAKQKRMIAEQNQRIQITNNPPQPNSIQIPEINTNTNYYAWNYQKKKQTNTVSNIQNNKRYIQQQVHFTDDDQRNKNSNKAYSKSFAFKKQFKKAQSQQFFADQSNTQNQFNFRQDHRPNQKNRKNKQKKKGKNKQQQYYSQQNLIKQKNPNLFTIQKLKIQEPLTRNYKIAKKQQWQKNNKIQDYKLQFVLRKFNKIKDYRNNQKAIIKCSLLGNDVFVCMPTGGGKSLTFQAMTFIQKGIYLCILPLVSLIIDQQEQAKKLGIKAYSLTGSKQIQDNKMIYQQMIKYQPGQQSIVVFCTPEKVNKSPQFFNILQTVYQRNVLVKIVIDQVHCVSTWGKQFRQDYQALSTLRQNFPKTPILGLTATVTQVIKQDIIKRLGIQNCYYFQSSFNRPNLYYQVKQKNKDILNNIIKIISQHENQSGIIYCVSRKDCEQMCNQLQSRRFKVAFYHANISQSDKRQIQAKWMENKIQIIIATIAFGMGINKPDVRFVIHHSLSKSLQNYYQESGRAGRDGENAKCILFYRKGDKISLQSLIMKNQISKDENKNFCMKQLSNMIKYCQDKYLCRRKFQLQYLGEKDFNIAQCNKTCDNCKRGLQYIEVQCIKQAKYLINFIIQIEKTKQNISQNQIIMICKGSIDKKMRYKFDQIERNVDLGQIKQYFSKWTKNNIDQLITQLLSCEVLYEKIVTTNTFKNNVVSNFYIRVNFSMANKFIQKVQTLPMKRNLIGKRSFNKQTYTDISDAQFDFQEQAKGQNDDIVAENQFQEDRYSYGGGSK